MNRPETGILPIYEPIITFTDKKISTATAGIDSWRRTRELLEAGVGFADLYTLYDLASGDRISSPVDSQPDDYSPVVGLDLSRPITQNIPEGSLRPAFTEQVPIDVWYAGAHPTIPIVNEFAKR